jgi:hypothetical protein
MIPPLTIAAIVWIEMIRRKDVYVLLVLLGALLLALISMNIFGLGGVAGYAQDVGLLLAWLFGWILTVAVSTRELPQEETRGTIFPLLAKPITRLQLLAGKWLGCWSIVCSACGAFYALVVLVALAQGGLPAWLVLAQAYILHMTLLGVIAAMGLMLSTRLHQDAAVALAYVLTAAAFLVVPRVPEFLVGEKGVRGVALLALYYVVPHFELFDLRRRLVHGYGPVEASVYLTVLGYGLVFILAFLMLAWLLYRHKRFVRGALPV